MKEKATELRTQLLADAAIATLVGDRVNWIIGEDNETVPVIVFSLSEILGLSKDSRKFEATIQCFSDNMDGASDLYELVLANVKANGHQFRGATSGLSSEEPAEAVIELNVELK